MLSLVELVPSVKQLSRAEKLRLMQFLVVDLAQGEGVPLLPAESEYPVWTPLHADEAADTLRQLLEMQTAKP